MSIAPLRAAPPIPPPPGDPAQRLAAVRAKLDEVDDALHDLLMRRADLVTEVAAVGAKGRVPLRPGREASILRRLVARNRGALDPATLVRIWREVLAGSSAQQSRMRVVAGDPSLLPAVREHFGALMTGEATEPADAVAQVRDGRASVAVLPLPGDAADWWTALVSEGGVHVVGRLPFWRRPGAAEAMLLAAAEPDPSGRDRSLLAGAPEAMVRAGLAVETVLARAGTLALAEVDGFVAAGDPRLREAGASRLGAYAVQAGPDQS